MDKWIVVYPYNEVSFGYKNIWCIEYVLQQGGNLKTIMISEKGQNKRPHII